MEKRGMTDSEKSYYMKQLDYWGKKLRMYMKIRNDNDIKCINSLNGVECMCEICSEKVIIYKSKLN